MNTNSVSKPEVNSSETPKHTTTASNSENTYRNPNRLSIPSLTADNNPKDKSNDDSSAQELQNRESIIDSENTLKCELIFESIDAPAGRFTDQKLRKDFIKKVYAILSLQILVMTISTGIMYSFFEDKLNFEKLKARDDNNGLAVVTPLLISSLVIAFITLLVFLCLSVSVRRAVPFNYIILGVFTAAWTVLVGNFCCQHNGEGILIALIVISIVVISITLLSTTPWFDITNCGLLLIVLVIINGIAYVVISHDLFALKVDKKLWIIVLLTTSAFLWTLFLLNTTQLTFGGKKYERNPKQYVFTAFTLYVYITNTFINILGIVGQTN